MSDEPASRNRAADRCPGRLSHLAGVPVTTSPRRGMRPPRGRRPPTLLLVAGTTDSKDRIVIGSGIADEEQACQLALDWSHAVRFEVTPVRSVLSRDAICSYRRGTEVPVPRLNGNRTRGTGMRCWPT
jgi:hypothetical protein